MRSSHRKESVEVFLAFFFFFFFLQCPTGKMPPWWNLNTLERLHCSAGWEHNEEPNDRQVWVSLGNLNSDELQQKHAWIFSFVLFFFFLCVSFSSKGAVPFSSTISKSRQTAAELICWKLGNSHQINIDG